MKNQDVYQLSHLSLILKEINIPIKQLDKIKQLPLFRIQVLKDNALLDEAQDVLASVIGKEKTLKLIIRSASFKYKKSDLFSLQKVAKLKINLYRMNSYGTDQQLIQQYKLVLSQYTYEYCRSITSIVNEHTVGLMKTSLFYYTENANKQSWAQYKLIKIPKLKRTISQSSQSIQLPKIDFGILPLDSIPFSFLPLKKKENAFISQQKPFPIQASSKISNDTFKIKFQPSQINIDEEKQISVLEQTQKMQRSTQNIKQWLFYIFIVVAMLQIVILMSPQSKIK